MGADCLCAPAPQKKVITMQQIVRKTSQQSVSRDKTSVKYSYTSSALSTRKLQSLRGELPPCLWLTSPEIFKRVRTKQTQWRVHPYFQFEARLLPDASASEHPVFLLKEPRYSGKIHAKKNYTHTNVSSLHTYEDPGPPSSAAFHLWEKGRGKQMDAAQPGPP